MMLRIAFRNILRNARRSTMTVLAIAVGVIALLVFGAYAQYDLYLLQTTAVERSGHLQVSRAGALDFGSGNPAIWGMGDHQAVMQLIAGDPVLAPMTAVLTPVQFLDGVAEYPPNKLSRTFFAAGYVPADLSRLKRWDEYGARDPNMSTRGLDPSDSSSGIMGLGFARLLGLCRRLHLRCQDPPANSPIHESAADISSLPSQDFSGLAETAVPAAGHGARATTIDLLSATASGAPNIVSMKIGRVEPQGSKEMDENYLQLNLAQAQQLVYGRGTHKVSAIILQLHRSEDTATGLARLKALIRQHRLPLEAHDYYEINSYYGQTEGFFNAVFSFIAVIMGVIVLFTVSNAMSMSVVERTDEIGTVRALGVRRGGIRRQFLLEGILIGLLGATLGVALAFAVTGLINISGMTWLPPGDINPIPLKLYLVGAPGLIVSVWAALIVAAALAALLPANRAARLPIVDALRHV
ncbi:MAG TPA: FtsX-like permease family protein [Rhizomicrobium sp.]|jgi:putative ABC transport system permease protein